jgi:hypothetical protein
MALSRRVFLTFVGFLPLAAWRAAARPAMADPDAVAPRQPDAGVVVVGGWVLRHDDLARLDPR